MPPAATVVATIGANMPKTGQRMQVSRRGVNDDGSPHYAYESERHVLITGPVRGTVTLADGTVVDVSPDIIELDTHEQALEAAHHIALRYEDEGHPKHDADAPFLHLCTKVCGKAARSIRDPLQAAAAARAQAQTDGLLDARTRAHHAKGLGTAAGDSASMALASATAENAALNGLDGTGSTNVIPDVSLHTASPGTTGANENANSGSYARQACSWNAASAGAKTNSSTLTFATAGSVAVTHIGTWSSATYGAGNYAIGAALGSSVAAASITVASGGASFSAT